MRLFISGPMRGIPYYGFPAFDAAKAAFEAILLAHCLRNGIETAWLGVGEIKKHATGKGNAPKNDVIAAMRARGFEPQDDNDADALALLFAYLEKEEA